MASEKTGHLERTAWEQREKDLLNVRLCEVQQINNRVRLLRLSLPTPTKVSAGQWLDTYIPGLSGAGGFTITSPPSAASSRPDPYFELAIQKSPDNPHAAWFWRPVNDIVDRRLQVRVGGSFVYPPVAKEFEGAKRVVLVAGGVGVNPLMSMMGEIADRGDAVEVKVLYGSKFGERSLSEILFLERMARMFRDGRLRGSMDVFLTTMPGSSALPDEHPEWLSGELVKLHEGRMAIQDVKKAIGTGKGNETLVYICGPPTMTDELVAAVGGVEHAAIEASRIMTEKWW